MSDKQKELKGKHGTPEQFEIAVWRAYACLFIDHDEATAAIQKYREEWVNAQ